MKTITNKTEAYCLTCFVGSYAVLNDNGQVVCENCGSCNLIDAAGEIFQPTFAEVK